MNSIFTGNPELLHRNLEKAFNQLLKLLKS